MTKVKIITTSMMGVSRGTEEPLENQVNDFVKGVIATHYSYAAMPGYQSVLIAYEERMEPKIKKVKPPQE